MDDPFSLQQMQMNTNKDTGRFPQESTDGASLNRTEENVEQGKQADIDHYNDLIVPGSR